MLPVTPVFDPSIPPQALQISSKLPIETTTTKMTTPDESTSTALHIEPIILDDIPQITELWYTVFGTPEMLHLFPDTPGLRQWWDGANRHDLQHKPAQKYLKAVDESGKMVAYAKWDLAVQERGERFPPWHAESDQEACERFFGGLDEGRERLVVGRKCYCMLIFLVFIVLLS